MSKLYDVTVVGDGELGCWLAAFVFASADLRVALVIRNAPDPGLPAFPALPLDPSRSTPVLSPFNLAPVRAPRPAYLPDLQIIVGGRPLDVVADPERRERAIARDFQEMAPEVSRRALELTGLATRVMAAARANNFPALGSGLLDRVLPWKIVKNRAWQAEGRESFDEWAAEAPPLVRSYFLATASAALGLPLTGSAPLVQVALGYAMVTSLHAGPGPEADLREQAAALTARRGAVMEAEPEALIHRGRALTGIRLKGGQIIDTKLLIAPAKRVYTLLGPNREGRADQPCLQRLVHQTYFYKLERDTLPESLAMRAVVAGDPEGGQGADNLLILSRATRVPRRDTAAVTLISPPPDFDPEAIPARLASSLPWLDPARMEPDDTRGPVIVRVPAPDEDFFAVMRPRFPFDNVFALPLEILPAWGPLSSAAALPLMRAEFMARWKK